MGARGMRSRTWMLAGAGIAVGLVAVAAVGLWLAPRVLPNLMTTVAEADTVQHVGGSGIGPDVAVTVPAGWSYHRAWGDEAMLVVRTPDAAVTVTVTASSASAADTVPLVMAELGEDAPVSRERLASGLDLRHAVGDGVLVAVVGAGEAAASVSLVARASAGVLPDYRAVLAVLIESVAL
jgi:hypothetical protein